MPDGQWYLHLFDSSQPDWNWRDPRVGAMFEEILRFWLDRGIGGFRVDVAHGLFKDPQLADVPDVTLTNRPSAYYHRPEVHTVYRRWREILDSYPSDGFPGARTAVGEVWADSAATLKAYLADDELPQIFNFDLVQAKWSPAAAARGDREPPTRSRTDRAPPGSSATTTWSARSPDGASTRPARPRCCCSRCPARPTSTRARNSACPRSRTSPTTPDETRPSAGPGGRRSAATAAGSRFPGQRPVLPSDFPERTLALTRRRPGFRSRRGGAPSAWRCSPATPAPSSRCTGRRCGFAVSTRRWASGTDGGDAMRWLDAPDQALFFARDPGFVFAVNLGDSAVPLPPHSAVLLASGPLGADDGGRATLPRNTAAWLAG